MSRRVATLGLVLVPILAAVLAVTGAGARTVPGHAGAAGRVVVLARHLDNPRGVALGPSGAVYVAEAGHGGSSCDASSDVCVGFTAALGRYRAGHYSRVATHLFSTADESPRGTYARGLDGISVAPSGALYGIAAGAAGAPDRLLTPAVTAQLERVVRFWPGPRVRSPRVGDYERAHNPGGGDVESDPYGIGATNGTRYVADAGGNDLLRVDHGHVALVAVFPRHDHVESVPTCVAIGPDGAIYVGEYTGGGPGQARVWRVVPGHAPKVFRAGLTQITGVAFGPGRALYVTEPSDVVRITPGGKRTRFGVGTLSDPAGTAVDGRGRIYTSNNSQSSTANGGGGGQLVRIDP